MQLHRESVSLPPGAVRPLADSDACLNQAFRWTDSAHGLQFHAEIDPPLAQWI
jgi:GMP synthase-like glutamine amidotransferase